MAQARAGNRSSSGGVGPGGTAWDEQDGSGGLVDATAHTSFAILPHSVIVSGVVAEARHFGRKHHTGMLLARVFTNPPGSGCSVQAGRVAVC